MTLDVARKVACGFGAGISKTGNICGAVSGAVLVICVKYGKAVAGDDGATDKTRALVREFIRQFSERNGSINCTALLGCNLDNPAEYQRAKNEGLFTTRCPMSRQGRGRNSRPDTIESPMKIPRSPCCTRIQDEKIKGIPLIQGQLSDWGFTSF